MSESLKAAVTRAVLRLLDPLVRLLLEAGIGVGEFHQLAKMAFARAARDAAPEARPNISRIAVLTGIPRGEVAEILSRPDDQPPAVERGGQRAERVLQGWWNDPEFCDADGMPLQLPLRGPKRSFAALVKRYAGDPRTTTLAKELLRVKAVRRAPDGKLEVLSRTFVTARWDNAGIEMVGDHVRDLLDTLVHNLKHPSRPRYARFVANAELDPRYVPLLLRDITQQAEVLADTFQDALQDPERSIRPARSAQDAHRITIGIFVVDEATLVAAASPAVVPARRRAKG
jgi:AcrR family transcriptional regulator